MNLPTLPDGYSWWIDEYDLRILQNNAEEDYWSGWSIGEDYDNQPDPDGRFFHSEPEERVEEYTDHSYFLFFKKKRLRAFVGTKITNVRWTVVSRLEYYDSMFLERQHRSQQDTLELWGRIKSDGPNSLSNIEGRAKALMLRFNAIQENKKMRGHYPPKTTKDWT